MALQGLFRMPLKYYVLGLLVFQNGGAVLLMRAVRALPGEKEFTTQTAVIMQEVLKAATCMLIVMCQQGTLRGVVENRGECLKTAVPALLYLIQNNLQYVAVGSLEAAVYAVTYQTKVFWVAICSVVFLRKRVGRRQWLALVFLMAGVCVVQLRDTRGAAGGEGDDQQQNDNAVSLDLEMRRVLGMVVLLCAALCSSLAAVSFEKLLKDSTADMWTRNLQLAGFSLLCSLAPLGLTEEGALLQQRGFFHGYTPLTWLCIAMNGWGGLLVGAVIKYADAILKDVAIGASICVSAVGSVILFQSPVSWNLVMGIALVSWAVPLYAGRAHLGIPWLQGPESQPKPGSRGAPTANGRDLSSRGSKDHIVLDEAP